VRLRLRRRAAHACAIHSASAPGGFLEPAPLTRPPSRPSVRRRARAWRRKQKGPAGAASRGLRGLTGRTARTALRFRRGPLRQTITRPAFGLRENTAIKGVRMHEGGAVYGCRAHCQASYEMTLISARSRFECELTADAPRVTLSMPYMYEMHMEVRCGTLSIQERMQ
jgi:hypothetical protein